MKAVTIYPEDIGTSQWSEKWITFIKKFGYDDLSTGSPCGLVLLVNIETL